MLRYIIIGLYLVGFFGGCSRFGLGGLEVSDPTYISIIIGLFLGLSFALLYKAKIAQGIRHIGLCLAIYFISRGVFTGIVEEGGRDSWLNPGIIFLVGVAMVIFSWIWTKIKKEA